MKYFVGSLVLYYAVGLALAQGPRWLTCQKCETIEDEIGIKMKPHSPKIGVDQLENICPLLKGENSTSGCKFILTSWRTDLVKHHDCKGDKDDDLATMILQKTINWLRHAGRRLHEYKKLCEMVHICQA